MRTTCSTNRIRQKLFKMAALVAALLAIAPCLAHGGEGGLSATQKPSITSAATNDVMKKMEVWNNPDAARRFKFDELVYQIKTRPQWDNARLEREVLRPEALVLETDRTPVDIVLRRTRALLNHLRTMPGGPALVDEERELNQLAGQNAPGLQDGQLRKLFDDMVGLRRRIAFQNPLLDFKDIVFLDHPRNLNVPKEFPLRYDKSHMTSQYLGFNQFKRGGVYVLADAFGPNPRLRRLTAEAPVRGGRLDGRILHDTGAFISLELDYEARTLYFAFTEANGEIPSPQSIDIENMSLLDRFRNEAVVDPNSINRKPGPFYLPHYYWASDRTFHIFRMKLDDGSLTQLTDGSYNDFDPVVLPNGRIVFVSERIGGNLRCGQKFYPTTTLHAMMPDGADIIPLSFHETNEWHPSVDNDGRLVYTRWDYVDRFNNVAHHLWHCFPDGRDPRSMHGNYPDIPQTRPNMEMSIRAIPGRNGKYVATAAPHHGQAYGSLVLIDLSRKDDGAMAQIKRITPEILFPESEVAPGVPIRSKELFPDAGHVPELQAYGQFKNNEVFGTAWPLDEDFHLAVYALNTANYGIYLVDSFGNRIKVLDDPRLSCLDPIPLKPRRPPPIIPPQTIQAQADRAGPATDADLAYGLVSVVNVYESAGPWPAGTRIKELRVINLFPKSNAQMQQPAISRGWEAVARGVLGVVPVEEDGSAYFKVPTGVPIYFQALDENGLAVQSMRSATYLHPGERLNCVGCHESKHAAPAGAAAMPRAYLRPPSELRQEGEGSYPMTFARLVRPVLERHCVSCHKNTEQRVRERDWVLPGRILKQTGFYSIPGQVGARASRLYDGFLRELLTQGTHRGKKLEIPREELRRITTWLDCASMIYGTYYDVERQDHGEVVRPLLGIPPYIPFEKLVR